MGQDLTVERIADLCAQNATTNPAGKATEDGSRHRPEGYTDRAGERADNGTSLTSSQCSADAARNTA